MAGRPLSINALTKLLAVEAEDVEKAFLSLNEEYRNRQSGLHIMRIGEEIELATAESHSALIQAFLKEEVQSELSRPSLETLTILAYRGALTKSELENIRGVNCSLILRNLSIKGLVETSTHEGIEKYQPTFEFMKMLGIPSFQELPEYERLNKKVNELTS